MKKKSRGGGYLPVAFRTPGDSTPLSAYVAKADRQRATPGLNPPFHALVRYSHKENDPSLLEIARAIRAQAPTMKGWVLIVFDDVGFQTLGDGEIPSLRLLDDALERSRIDAIAHGKIGPPQEKKK